MFTGLIHGVGKLQLHGNKLKIDSIESPMPFSLGDSIAVDGVCLTVAVITSSGFLANVSEETLKKTTLGAKAQRNAFVNLEPAIRLSDRLGGHIVSGHVDGLGEIIAIDELNQSWNIALCWKKKAFGKYICEKASIALNGISLTISDSSDEGSCFSMAIIPHTWENTTLKHLKIGELVNLEADLVAKYIESLLKNNNLSPTEDFNKISEDISKGWLQENGWG